MGAGVAFDSAVDLEPSNVASREILDKQTPSSGLWSPTPPHPLTCSPAHPLTRSPVHPFTHHPLACHLPIATCCRTPYTHNPSLYTLHPEPWVLHPEPYAL